MKNLNEAGNANKVAVLCNIPNRTAAFLDAEVAKIEKRHEVKYGRATICRAALEALEIAKFPVAQAPSSVHLRDEIVKALTAYNSRQQEEK